MTTHLLFSYSIAIIKNLYKVFLFYRHDMSTCTGND